jgi:hypothetical protein
MGPPSGTCRACPKRKVARKSRGYRISLWRQLCRKKLGNVDQIKKRRDPGNVPPHFPPKNKRIQKASPLLHSLFSAILALEHATPGRRNIIPMLDRNGIICRNGSRLQKTCP